MLETDLENFRNSLALPSLDGLEGDVWQKIAADQEATRMRQIVLTCQAGVVAMVVAGGLALSGIASKEASASSEFDAFSLKNVPAPSTLLLGVRS
jgi:hypothetical protein